MGKTAWRIVLAVFPVVLLFAGNAMAFSQDVFLQRDKNGVPVRWQRDSVVLTVSQPGVNDLHMSKVKLLKYTQQAVGIFNDQFGMTLTVEPANKLIPNTQEDGVNEIAFKQYSPCTAVASANAQACDDENRFGHTRVYPSTTIDSAGYRTIVEADIELNASAFNELPPADVGDRIIAILRHEIGHLLGLAHNCVASPWHQQQYHGKHKPPVCDQNSTAHVTPLMYPLLLHKTKKQTQLTAAEIETLRQLFPVGERMVSRRNRANEAIVDEGGASSTIPFMGHELATYICFESLFGEHVRTLASSAELLVNPSYDGWFMKSTASQFHEALGRIRAIENRKALVRAAMSGISTIVDPVGRMVQRADVGESATLISTVAFMSLPTLYSRIGRWPWYALLLLISLGGCVATVDVYRKSRRP